MGDPPVIEHEGFKEALRLKNTLQIGQASEKLEAIIQASDTPENALIEAFLLQVEVKLTMGRVENLDTIFARLETLPLSPHQVLRKLIYYYDYGRTVGKFNRDLSGEILAYCEQHLEDCQDLLVRSLVTHAIFSDFEERKKLFERAKEVLTMTPSVLEEINYLQWLAFRVHDGDLEQSIGILEQSIELAQKHLEYPQDMICIGYLRMMGIYRAFTCFEEVIEVGPKCLELIKAYDVPPNYLHFCYYHLSSAYLEKGDYFEAIFYGQKGIYLSKNQFQRFEMIHCESLAEAYINIGKAELGLKFAERALEITKSASDDWEQNPYLYYTYFALALCYEKVDQTKAIYYHKECVRLGEGEKGSQADIYGAYTGLAVLNPNEEGLKYAKLVLEAFQDDFSNKLVGNAYLALQNEEKALEHYFIALKKCLPSTMTFDLDNPELFLQFNNYVTVLETSKKIGQVYYQQFTKNDSPKLLEKSIAYFDYTRQLLAFRKRDSQAKSQIVFNDQLPNEYRWYLLGLSQQSPINFDKILDIFEECKGDILHQSLVEKQVQKGFQNQPFFKEEQTLRGAIRKLEQEMEQAETEEQKQPIFEQFADKRKAHQTFVDSIKDDYPAYFQAKYETKHTTIEAIQSVLKEDEKILNYLLTDKDIFILFIDVDEVELVRISKPETLEQDILDLFKAIKFYDKQTYYAKAKKLHQLLIDPVGDLLMDIFGGDEITDLTIIPHGLLAKIPFETLFNELQEDQPDYLLNTFNISYYYSVSLLVENRLKKQGSLQQGFLGVAPIYEKASSKTFTAQAINRSESEAIVWNPLPFSKKEVEGIAKFFVEAKQPTEVLLHEEASKEQLLKNLTDYSFVHLAAHFHQHEIPQRSGLVLGDDTYLFIDDAYGMDLETNLIVLSACESGIGEVSNSEGMMAISRALLYAGVKNIVTTLFEINDELASKLMLLFYKEILSGQTIKASLNNAKRKLIGTESVNERIWAAFTLVGV